MTPDQHTPNAGGDAVAGLVEITQRLEGVEEVLADLVETMAARPAGGPWLWSGLDDQAREKLWGQLGEFVAWLHRTYLTHLSGEDYRIPACWYHHPVAVEHLTALMVAHKYAYSEQTAEPSAALVDFHERSLWPTLDRLRMLKVFRKCLTDGRHHDDQRPAVAWAPDEDFTAYTTNGGGGGP